jgi:hypothetical protein
MNTIKIHVSRKDFREATKVCRLKGHSICRCVVANAVIRTGLIAPDTLGVGYNQFHGRDSAGKTRTFETINDCLPQVVNLFDDGFDGTSADKMYKNAKELNILDLTFTEVVKS